MLCYVMLCYVMLCYVMYVMLCYVMLCYVMLCYVYAMLCYAMLCQRLPRPCDMNRSISSSAHACSSSISFCGRLGVRVGSNQY
ncbi:hypothetical protein T484DRAFT_1615894 [Baffinella frigidus]|nr:hypothetical protein T484DRAFT_1615894 [Cryptophyta sp. CCMP2293]